MRRRPQRPGSPTSVGSDRSNRPRGILMVFLITVRSSRPSPLRLWFVTRPVFLCVCHIWTRRRSFPFFFSAHFIPVHFFPFFPPPLSFLSPIGRRICFLSALTPAVNDWFRLKRPSYRHNHTGPEVFFFSQSSAIELSSVDARQSLDPTLSARDVYRVFICVLIGSCFCCLNPVRRLPHPFLSPFSLLLLTPFSFFLIPFIFVGVDLIIILPFFPIFFLSLFFPLPPLLSFHVSLVV